MKRMNIVESIPDNRNTHRILIQMKYEECFYKLVSFSTLSNMSLIVDNKEYIKKYKTYFMKDYSIMEMSMTRLFKC